MAVMSPDAHDGLTWKFVSGGAGSIRHDRFMAAAGSIRTQNAEQLRRAMKENGYSLREMAIEVENVRKLRVDDDLPTLQSLQRTISHILATGQIGQMWRDDLAAVFGIDPDELFSPPTETKLPHPLLVH